VPAEDTDRHAACGTYSDYPLVSLSLLPIGGGVLNKPHVRINHLVKGGVKSHPFQAGAHLRPLVTQLARFRSDAP
jgi:hypothetical protein